MAPTLLLSNGGVFCDPGLTSATTPTCSIYQQSNQYVFPPHVRDNVCRVGGGAVAVENDPPAMIYCLNNCQKPRGTAPKRELRAGDLLGCFFPWGLAIMSAYDVKALPPAPPLRAGPSNADSLPTSALRARF